MPSDLHRCTDFNDLENKDGCEFPIELTRGERVPMATALVHAALIELWIES